MTFGVRSPSWRWSESPAKGGGPPCKGWHQAAVGWRCQGWESSVWASRSRLWSLVQLVLSADLWEDYRRHLAASGGSTDLASLQGSASERKADGFTRERGEGPSAR